MRPRTGLRGLAWWIRESAGAIRRIGLVDPVRPILPVEVACACGTMRSVRHTLEAWES